MLFQQECLQMIQIYTQWNLSQADTHGTLASVRLIQVGFTENMENYWGLLKLMSAYAGWPLNMGSA